MIDRTSRNTLNDCLRRAALGHLSGFECEDIVMGLPALDSGVVAMGRTMRALVDETDASLKPVLSDNPEMRVRLHRWRIFLQSDQEYPWPEMSLPPGILDFYQPDIVDRMTAATTRHQEQIEKFMKAGEYEFWPFLSKTDFRREQSIGASGIA
jgi:hypothetical protein